LIQLAKDHIQAAAIKGRPDDVPKYKKYVDVADATPGSTIGLRLGTYGDANQTGPDRDSHHTTQWLLIEYFRNQTDDLKPFPKSEIPGWKVAGVSFEGSAATRFENPADSSQAVRFKELDKGDRGEAMPAILIARKLHHEGDLHIKGATPEDFAKTRPTQGGAVHDTFQKALFTGEFATWKGASDFSAKVQAEPSKFGNQLYTALQATYAETYRKMEPALEKGLRTIEMTYYLEIAAKHHTLQKDQPDEHLDPDFDPAASEFENVAALAKTNNDTVMGGSGWKAPY
jgi:Novel toxin 14